MNMVEKKVVFSIDVNTPDSIDNVHSLMHGYANGIDDFSIKPELKHYSLRYVIRIYPNEYTILIQKLKEMNDNMFSYEVVVNAKTYEIVTPKCSMK